MTLSPFSTTALGVMGGVALGVPRGVLCDDDDAGCGRMMIMKGYRLKVTRKKQSLNGE